MQNSGLIHFRCAAPAHDRAVDGRLADTLTIVEGRWGFCQFDANAKEHHWQATGGVPIEQLRRGTPDISVVLDVRPRPAPLEPVAPGPRKSAKRSRPPA